MCICSPDFLCPEAQRLWEEANKLSLHRNTDTYFLKMYHQHRVDNAYKEYEPKEKNNDN